MFFFYFWKKVRSRSYSSRSNFYYYYYFFAFQCMGSRPHSTFCKLSFSNFENSSPQTRLVEALIKGFDLLHCIHRPLTLGTFLSRYIEAIAWWAICLRLHETCEFRLDCSTYMACMLWLGWSTSHEVFRFCWAVFAPLGQIDTEIKINCFN